VPPVVATPVVVKTVAPAIVSVADEIKAAHLTALSHLNKLQEKIIKVITETGVEQRKFEEDNKKSYNDASSTLRTDAERIKSTTEELLRLKNDVQTLNATIHIHYRRLIRDSEYLHTLDVMKPTFLKSLDDLNNQIKGIKTSVVTKIVKDRYKREMVILLSHINFNTQNITGFVADNFMKHYNKYKHLLDTDKSGYAEDLNKLNKLVEAYRIQAQKVADATTEYNKILSLVTKLKATYDTSVAENADLDDLVKRVLTLMKTKNCAK
jgi:hypothetical protein